MGPAIIVPSSSLASTSATDVKSNSKKEKGALSPQISVDLEDITEKKDGGVLKQVLICGDVSVKTPRAGDKVKVKYVGRIGKKEFDRNDGLYPFGFILGQGQVIKGWEVAIATMHLNEKAQFTIRGDYGYGVAGQGNDIPANATLDFEVELLAIEAPIQQNSRANDMERLAALRAEREKAAKLREEAKLEKERKKKDALEKLAEKKNKKGGGRGRKQRKGK